MTALAVNPTRNIINPRHQPVRFRFGQLCAEATYRHLPVSLEHVAGVVVIHANRGLDTVDEVRVMRTVGRYTDRFMWCPDQQVAA